MCRKNIKGLSHPVNKPHLVGDGVSGHCLCKTTELLELQNRRRDDFRNRGRDDFRNRGRDNFRNRGRGMILAEGTGKVGNLRMHG